jgi:hypothetical protein
MAKVYTLTMTENERLPPTLRGINRREVKYGLILLGGVSCDGIEHGAAIASKLAPTVVFALFTQSCPPQIHCGSEPARDADEPDHPGSPRRYSSAAAGPKNS